MRYLLDSNLMTLLVVGLARRGAVVGHRRLDAYTADDFERLFALVGSGQGLIVSAYVMTEVSNLAVDHVREPLRSEIRGVIRFLIESNQERHVPCEAAAARPEFPWLGLADAALLEHGSDCTLVTADSKLANAAWAGGKRATQFGPNGLLIAVDAY